MSELSIKLRIGNREYPMRIRVEDEERIRRAGRILNEKAQTYKERFGIDDQQDLLAMVALQYATQALELNDKSTTLDKGLNDQLKVLNGLISEVL